MQCEAVSQGGHKEAQKTTAGLQSILILSQAWDTWEKLWVLVEYLLIYVPNICTPVIATYFHVFHMVMLGLKINAHFW